MGKTSGFPALTGKASGYIWKRHPYMPGRMRYRRMRPLYSKKISKAESRTENPPYAGKTGAVNKVLCFYITEIKFKG